MLLKALTALLLAAKAGKPRHPHPRTGKMFVVSRVVPYCPPTPHLTPPTSCTSVPLPVVANLIAKPGNRRPFPGKWSDNGLLGSLAVPVPVLGMMAGTRSP